MTEEELINMFERDNYPYDQYIKHYKIVEFKDIIRTINIKYKLELAELKAKVYTYEKIIANSNFATILVESKRNIKNKKEVIKSERRTKRKMV